MIDPDKLDLGEYVSAFESFLARPKPFILQGDINTHYRYIAKLQTYEFTPPPPVKNLDQALMHLSKQGVLPLEEIYEFIKIIDYFAYLKTLAFEGKIKEWIDNIKIPEQISEISSFFDDHGGIDINKDETLYGLHRAYERSKKEIRQKLYGMTNNRDLQNFLVDRQVHFHDQQECLLVRGGFHAVMKASVVGRSSGGFFYVLPQSVSQLRQHQSGILDKIEQIKTRYAREFSAVFHTHLPFLRFINKTFDQFDHYQARIFFAKAKDYSFILPNKSQKVRLGGFLHPALKEGVSCDISLEKKVMIITGVNAGGKTMLLKSLLSAVFMAKYLLPMHCNPSHTQIGSFKSIEAIIDDPQNVKNDISTFAGRMLEFSKMFNKTKAIAGVDEIELGTDSDEAASLFKVILSRLIKRDITLIVTTHHKRLASLMASSEDVELVAAVYDKKKQLPTYTFLQGAIGKSYAFETAQRYGIAKNVVAEAKEVFGEDKEKLNELIEKSTTLESQLRKKISQADKNLAHLQKQQQELDAYKQKLAADYDAMVAQLTRGYEAARKELKQAINKDTKTKHRALNSADKTQKNLRQNSAETKNKAAPKAAGLKVGQWVRYNNSKGVITKLSNKKAFVEINGMTLQVKKEKLTPAAKPKKEASVDVAVQKEAGFVKLDLHGMRWEEARDELDRFVSNALLHSFDEVFVYHGVGSGALARMVREFCKNHPRIASCEDAAPNQGGSGATVIKF